MLREAIEPRDTDGPRFSHALDAARALELACALGAPDR
jgi:hypothetical protein